VPADEITGLARDIAGRCRLHGRFTLRSGQVSDEYFDKYLFEADPVLLRRMTDQMAALVPTDADLLGGLELGATVRTVVCAIDRSAPGENELSAAGIETRAVLTKDLLDSAGRS
jgi:orotate phosphoribosyltransferase